MKKRKTLYVIIVAAVLMVGVLPFLRQKIQNAHAELNTPVPQPGQMAILQDNSLSEVANPENPDPQVAMAINAIITAYSSTPWQTDNTPFITAAGTAVKDGVIANNLLPFGTEVKIPSLFGNKIFTVEDRMNAKKSNNQFDIWFSSTAAAEDFGVKNALVEVLEK